MNSWLSPYTTPLGSPYSVDFQTKTRDRLCSCPQESYHWNQCIGNSCLFLIPLNTARGCSGGSRDRKSITIWNAEKAPHAGENLINLKDPLSRIWSDEERWMGSRLWAKGKLACVSYWRTGGELRIVKGSGRKTQSWSGVYEAWKKLVLNGWAASRLDVIGSFIWKWRSTLDETYGREELRRCCNKKTVIDDKMILRSSSDPNPQHTCSKCFYLTRLAS